MPSQKRPPRPWLKPRPHRPQARLRVRPLVSPLPPPAAALAAMPAELRAMLRHLRTEIEKNCDYVGADFAEEARKIHHGEAEARGIFGEASEEEAEALREEGIEIGHIPWVPPTDA